MKLEASTPQVTLVVAHHDPQGRLAGQMGRILPRLVGIFGKIAVAATPKAHPADLELWRGIGARVEQEKITQAAPVTQVGQTRRAALAAGLKIENDFLLYCDSDRILHWAEYYPAELAGIAATLPEHDLTVLGRTQRAYQSHPLTQRETEILINRVFALASGQAWDTGAAARGLSRRAAQELLAHCPDTQISNDVTWPLHLLRNADFTCAYIETEGLEYETADRFAAEVQAAGGKQAWMARLDADPHEWASRLNLAQIEIQAILDY